MTVTHLYIEGAEVGGVVEGSRFPVAENCT